MSEPFSQKFLFSSPNTQERKNLSLSLSTSAVFSRDATEKNGRRPQRWRDVRDSRPLFFLFSLSRVPLALSLSLCLFVRVAFYTLCREIFFAPFFPSRVWVALGVGLHAKGENAKIRASRRRVWTRIDGIARKKMRRAWFSSGATRGGGSDDARPRPRSRDLDFWFWVGHLIPRGSSPCVRAC